MDLDDKPVIIGNNTYLFEPGHPTEAASDVNVDSPGLIVLCTWLGGATISRISKYTSWYRSRYPTATILLIRTVYLDITARSFTSIRARLRPACDVIVNVLQQAQSGRQPSLLLHIFSHGGCNTAIQLAHALKETAEPGQLYRNLRQIVFDSCPGNTSFEKAYNATLVSLPPQLQQGTIAAAAAYLPVALVTGLQKSGLMRSVDDLRRELSDPHLFGSDARRLYLVSAKDVMVDVKDVVSHAREGREKGFEVGVVPFKNAPHCALVTEDADPYWAAIEDTWGRKSATSSRSGRGRGKQVKAISPVADDRLTIWTLDATNSLLPSVSLYHICLISPQAQLQLSTAASPFSHRDTPSRAPLRSAHGPVTSKVQGRVELQGQPNIDILSAAGLPLMPRVADNPLVPPHWLIVRVSIPEPSMLMQRRQRDMIKRAVIQIWYLGRRGIGMLILEPRHTTIVCAGGESDVDLLKDVIGMVVDAAVDVFA